MRLREQRAESFCRDVRGIDLEGVFFTLQIAVWQQAGRRLPYIVGDGRTAWSSNETLVYK